jgi:hypothetical protein
MADQCNLHGQKLEAALNEFAEVGFRRRMNTLEETPTRRRKFIHVCMYFITPMLLFHVLMMCRCR